MLDPESETGAMRFLHCGAAPPVICENCIPARLAQASLVFGRQHAAMYVWFLLQAYQMLQKPGYIPLLPGELK